MAKGNNKPTSPPIPPTPKASAASPSPAPVASPAPVPASAIPHIPPTPPTPSDTDLGIATQNDAGDTGGVVADAGALGLGVEAEKSAACPVPGAACVDAARPSEQGGVGGSADKVAKADAVDLPESGRVVVRGIGAVVIGATAEPPATELELAQAQYDDLAKQCGEFDGHTKKMLREWEAEKKEALEYRKRCRERLLARKLEATKKLQAAQQASIAVEPPTQGSAAQAEEIRD